MIRAVQFREQINPGETGRTDCPTDSPFYGLSIYWSAGFFMKSSYELFFGQMNIVIHNGGIVIRYDCIYHM